MSMRDIKINRLVNTNAMYIKNWLKLLCDIEERLNDFTTNFLDKKHLWLSLCRFQVHSKMTGRGKSITLEELQECIDTGNDYLLKLSLQDLLLIPVSSEALKVFKQQTNLENFMKKVKEYSKIPIIDFTGDSIRTIKAFRIRTSRRGFFNAERGLAQTND